MIGCKNAGNEKLQIIYRVIKRLLSPDVLYCSRQVYRDFLITLYKDFQYIRSSCPVVSGRVKIL